MLLWFTIGLLSCIVFVVSLHDYLVIETLDDLLHFILLVLLLLVFSPLALIYVAVSGLLGF